MPYPAGLGSIAQGLQGYPQADLERWRQSCDVRSRPAWTSLPIG